MLQCINVHRKIASEFSLVEMRGDCYYFMTSTCARGSACAYRHNEAAKHADKVCPIWESGQECPDECPNKHSNYQEKEKKNILCYWESHGGCKKNNCPYTHSNKNPESANIEKTQINEISHANNNYDNYNTYDMTNYDMVHVKTLEELEKDLQEVNKIL